LDLLPINLDAALIEVLEQLDKEIQDKQAHVEIQRPLSSLLAHLPTLKQILTNLLCNAVKFVEPGQSPRIQIRTDRGSNMVRLWVEDNGIGIATEHQERIFGLFQRLHTHQAYPGTGVGLAIVRKGVERMGGRVGIESRPGEGSRFWIELPAAITTEHAQHHSSR
jgi:signal transduction histidine kinase